MSTHVICDVCGKEFVAGQVRIERDGQDFHDTPACWGAVQAAVAGVVTEARKPK